MWHGSAACGAAGLDVVAVDSSEIYCGLPGSAEKGPDLADWAVLMRLVGANP